MAEVRERSVAVHSGSGDTDVVHVSSTSTSGSGVLPTTTASSSSRRGHTLHLSKREKIVERVFVQYWFVVAIGAIALLLLSLLPPLFDASSASSSSSSLDAAAPNTGTAAASKSDSAKAPKPAAAPKAPKAPDIHLTLPNGVPKDGVPSYHERAMMLLINGARTSPYQFHMTFLAASSSSPPKASIYALASTAYHQTLYWNFNLARGAAKEAEKHRAMIKGEYTGTDIGQYSSQVMLLNAPTPFEAVDRLLCQRMDNGLCTPDVTATDHRKMLLDMKYSEIGISYVNLGQEVKVAEEAIGYDDGTNSTVAIAKPPATHLWMIYLGNRPPVKKHTIAVGAHFLRTELPNPPSIEFMVTWEDPYQGGPGGARVFINNAGFTIRVTLGAAERGVLHYAHTPREIDYQRRDDTCLTYWFEIIDSKGDTHRYPEEGYFLTYGVRDCTANWEPLPATPE